MLRRQVSGSFVCLSCRLQQRGHAALQRRPFAFSARARSNEDAAADRQRIIEGITADAAPRRWRQQPNNDDDLFEPDDAEPNEPKPSEETFVKDHDLENRVIIQKYAYDYKPRGGTLAEDDDLENRVTIQKYAYDRKSGRETLAEDDDLENTVTIQKYAYDPFRRADGTLSLDSDNKMVRSRGQRFSVDDADLPIDILGKPGAAIVMRSKGQLRKFIPEEEEVAEDPEASTDITEAMEEALGADDDDYLLNIHELRQTDRTLTEIEFNALKDTLVKGFTKVQLEEYLADSESFPRDPVQEVPQLPDPEWVVSRRPWVPDATAGTKDRGDIMRGYMSKSMTPKQRLVIELLRKRWNVSCDSVSGNMGRLDVALRDVEFSLLLLGSKRWLRDITRNYLETGCQIEIIVSTNTVSIRAPRTRSEVILQAINNVLSKSKTRALDADLISPDPIDPGLLEDVGRITNSVVRSSGRQILVTWVNLPIAAQGLEDLADVVFRYLFSAFHDPLRASSAMRILPPQYAKGGRLVTNYACHSQLPWHERRKQWARWVVASPAQGDMEAKKPNKRHLSIPASFLPHKIDVWPSDHGVKEPIKMPVPFSGDKIPTPPPRPWSSHLITDTQAVFGQVLHAPPPPPPSPSSPPTAPQKLDTSLPRSFVPTLPPLTALDFASNIHEEGLWHSTLVLQFLPAPSSPDAPPLELRIEADHTELKRIVSLRAVASSFAGDALFPAAPVDVRLRQDRYFELPGDGIDVHAPAVAKFLQAADLRPWAGKLATPPMLEGLMLPRRLFGLDPSSSSSPAEESDGANSGVEQDAAQETLEETASPVAEAEEAVVEELAKEAAAEELAEEAVAEELAEEVVAEELAEEAVTEDLAEEAVAEVLAEEDTAKELEEAVAKELEEAVAQELAEEGTAQELAKEAAAEELGEEAVSEELAEDAVAEELAEEAVAEELTEEAVSEVLAEEDTAQQLAEETASPVEQESSHETATPDTPAPASPDTSSEQPPHETTLPDPAEQQPDPAWAPEPDLVPVTYRFAAIEIQRVVTANHEGFRLGYRSTEAGQRGGKRSELVLRAAAAPGVPHVGGGGVRKPVIHNATTFLRIAAELAGKVDADGAGAGRSASAPSAGGFSWHGRKVQREDGDDAYMYVR